MSSPAIIRTPDQRVRVFISSTLQELAPERAAARAAVNKLRLIPVMFELGARPHPPRPLYRAYLDQSHIVIGIYWQKYGWVAPDMDVSGLEDEYNLSAGKLKLIYIKHPAPEREPRLQDLLKRIQSDDEVSYKPFSTPEELGNLIENDLAILLTERFELARLAAQKPPPEEAPPEEGVGTPNNLPVLRTSLVGRNEEVSALRQLLPMPDAGLVTLTGAGGTGKTRLALEVAARLLDDFPDGVFFVSLASIADPNLVASSAAQALGVREVANRPLVESLKEQIGEKRLLLVLDNFEHVIEAASLLPELLERCPRLTFLVTSRTPLRLHGEKEFPVHPLALPEREDRTAESLRHYAAVELFVQRAHDIRPGFELTAENAADVAEICYRLDGLPLAIELAAAQIRLFTPKGMLARLEHTLPLLRSASQDLPARQRTMRATIEWSHDLLSESQKALFRRLAVFSGGCTFEAAEFVCSGEEPGIGDMSASGGRSVPPEQPTPDPRSLIPELLEDISALVDMSLLAQVATEGESRFRMLATIREYGLERLAESGDEEVVRQQHVSYYTMLAEAAEPHAMGGPQQAAWLDRLEEEHDNLRAALDWLAERNYAEPAVRLAGLLVRFWLRRGYLREGRQRLNTILDFRLRIAEYSNSTVRNPQSAIERAKALHGAGIFAFEQGDYEQARKRFEEALALRREVDDRAGMALTLNNLANVALYGSDYERADALYRECYDLSREVGNDWMAVQALSNMGWVGMYRRDYAGARKTFEEALEQRRKQDDRWSIANSLTHVAWAAIYGGSFEEAASLAHEAQAIFEELGDKDSISDVLDIRGRAAFERGDYAQARELLSGSMAISRELGDNAGIALNLLGFAAMSAAQGGLRRAATLFGAADALRDATAEFQRAYFERHIAEARSRMPEGEWEAAWEAGHAMGVEGAVAYAGQEIAAV